MNKPGRHIDSRVWGCIGTVLVHAALLLLMFLTIFPVPEEQPEEEEGLTVNYGFGDDGDGLFEPAPQSAVEDHLVDAEPETEGTPPAPADPAPQATEELITQDDPETLALKAAEEKKKKEAEAERKRQEAELKAQEEARKAEEAKRIAAAEAKKKAEAAAKAKATAAARNAFSGNGSGGKGTSATSTGQGATGKAGNQGNPFGDPNSANLNGGGKGQGNGYSLAGRSVTGTLPKPVSSNNETGTVVVAIEVNAAGQVISAKPGAKGTNTYDPELWSAATAAAKKARFNGVSGSAVQNGTITYIFVN